MGAKFLCCLPLRLGVLVISIVQFFVNSIVAALLWYIVWYIYEHKSEVSTRNRVSFIVYGAITSVGALMALVGFIGTIRKKFSYISNFASMVLYLFVLQLIWSVIGLVLWFTGRKDKALDSCLQAAEDQNAKDACHKVWDNINKPWFTVVTIVIVVVPLLLQLYGCYIVDAYAKKLRKKNLDRDMILSTSGGFKYEAAAVHDDSRPLTQPDVVYPYKDAPNSFGNQGAHHSHA